MVEALWEGRYGLWTVMSGEVPGPLGMVWAYLPDFGAWITASALWLGAAALAVTAAAKRRPRG